MSNPTTLLQFMQNYAAATGTEIKNLIDEKGFAIMTEVDARLSALVGQDEAILTFLDKIKRLVDADPGTPEFEEGSNLFTVITEKYDAALAAVAQVRNIAEAAAASAAQLVADLTALALRVVALENESQAARRDINALRGDVDGLSVQLRDAFYGFADVASRFSSALRGTTTGA